MANSDPLTDSDRISEIERRFEELNKLLNKKDKKENGQ